MSDHRQRRPTAHEAALLDAVRDYHDARAEAERLRAAIERVRAEVQRMADDVAAGIPNTVGEYVGDLRRALDG